MLLKATMPQRREHAVSETETKGWDAPWARGEASL